MSHCEDCKHFQQRPGDTTWKRKTGCYHPEHMEQSQEDGFLKEQEIPGDHRKINAAGDCAEFEAREPRLSLLKRIGRAMRD